MTDPQVEHDAPQKEKKDDFVLSGIFVTFGLLLVMGFLVYLFTIQTNAQKCEPEFGPDGAIIKDCPTENDVAAPSGPIQQGEIEFLDNLKPKNNSIPELDQVQ